MIYIKELVQYKTTNFRHPPGLLKFRAQQELDTSMLKRFLNKIKFCENSLHGIQYLWEFDSRPAVRIFWLLVTVTAIMAFFTVHFLLASRHHEQKLTTVVKTSQMPIYTIDFPSVAICPSNHVNWLRYKAAEEKFLPNNANAEVKMIFHDLLKAMEPVSFTLWESIGRLAKRKNLPPDIKRIVLYDLAQFVAFRCEELFVTCIFDGTPHDCCKIFVQERTEKGICLVFNSMISEESKIKKMTDHFYPLKMRTSGEGTGLAFTLRYNKTLQRPGSKIPFAFNLLIKESEEWSDSLYYYLLPNTRNYLSVIPEITESSSNIRSMDPQKRHCLFSDENSDEYDRIKGLPFNVLNCRVQCQHKYVLKHCECTLSMFFPTMHIFNYIKSPRQDEHIRDSGRGMICDCIDNCQTLIYLVSPNTAPFKNPNASTPVVKADIYIGKNVITKYGTRLDYTTMDLLANFGGVLGLCLGANILSLLDVVYGFVRLIIVNIFWRWKKWRAMRRVLFTKHVTERK